VGQPTYAEQTRSCGGAKQGNRQVCRLQLLRFGLYRLPPFLPFDISIRFPELKSFCIVAEMMLKASQLKYPILVSLGATTGKARASTTRTHQARLILPLELVSACRSKFPQHDLEVVLWPAYVLGDSQLVKWSYFVAACSARAHLGKRLSAMQGRSGSGLCAATPHCAPSTTFDSLLIHIAFLICVLLLSSSSG